MANDWNEDDREESPGDRESYGKPTRAALIAAVAVAAAVFVFGAFVKTHKQLNAVRNESKKEIARLRREIDLLRKEPGGAGAVPERVSPAPVPAGSLPAARTAEDREAAERPAEPLVRAASGVSVLFSQQKNAGPPPQSGENRMRVVAVDNGEKKIMVEGGRDKGRAEGERLELSRGGRWIGDLRVVSVFDNLSACEVLHSVTLPEPGDLVRATLAPEL